MAAPFHVSTAGRRWRAAGIGSCVLLLLVLLSGASTVAQEGSAEGVKIRMGSPDGARRYRPGQWGLVEVTAINQTNEWAEAAAVLRFVDDPTLQFGRQVLVPPNSTLRTSCPIVVPQSAPADAQYVNSLPEQILPPPGPEAKRMSSQDTLLASQPVFLDSERPGVGLIADLDPPYDAESGIAYHRGLLQPPPAPDDSVYELVLAAKRAQNLTRRLSVFDSEDLPIDPAGLAVLDVLVLSTDRVATDPNGVQMLRDWVLGGGHLWILLDEVQPSTVAAVLGDAYATTLVDRVALMRLRMVNVRYIDIDQPVEEIELEEPVQLVRVIPSGVTVTATVDNWPASFWQPLGAGRVFFTTLSTAAWMRPPTRFDAVPQAMDEETAFVARQPLADLAEECFVPRAVLEPDDTALESVLTQQIGYRIVSQTTVVAILGAMCLVVAGFGLWSIRVGGLERLLWIAPLAAAVTSVVFLGAALATKRAVPPTVATVTRLVLEPGMCTGHASGLAAMYNRDASTEQLGATRGGLFFPDMTALTGRNRRVMWTDEGAWHWEQLELPAGVRTAPYFRPMPLDGTVSCRARFGPGGLEGTVAGLPSGPLEDAVIALPHQAAMVARCNPDGTFLSRVNDVLARGEFLAEMWRSDQQQRRKAVYEQIFAAQPEIDLPAEPILFGWSRAADLGFVFPQENQVGSTLVSVRLRLERTPAGTQVAVAASFIPYRAIADRQGRPPVAFSNVMRKWVDSKLALTEHLQFAIPREVLPIELRRAELSVTARAPSRSLELLAFAGGEPVVVLSLSHPLGTYSCVLDRPELLQLDETGHLELAVRVGRDESAEPGEEMALEPWTIHALQLSVAGTVQGE